MERFLTLGYSLIANGVTYCCGLLRSSLPICDNCFEHLTLRKVRVYGVLSGSILADGVDGHHR